MASVSVGRLARSADGDVDRRQDQSVLSTRASPACGGLRRDPHRPAALLLAVASDGATSLRPVASWVTEAVGAGIGHPWPAPRVPHDDRHPQEWQGGSHSARTARRNAIEPVTDERGDRPVLLAPDGCRLDRHGAGPIIRRVARCTQIATKVTPPGCSDRPHWHLQYVRRGQSAG